MNRLHWQYHTAQLREVAAASRFGIISDFDGTLSHFETDYRHGDVTPEGTTALNILIPRIALVALVSGRATADLRSHFDHPRIAYYGNHGMDYWHDGAVRVVSEAQPWQEKLTLLLSQLIIPANVGVNIEDKRVTASIHYRAAANPAEVRQMLWQQLQPLCDFYGFKLSEGRNLWEIKPPINVNKGTALNTLVQDYRLDSTIFLGDDVTDLSAMAMLRSLRESGKVSGLSVGVVHPQGVPQGMFDQCDVIAEGPDDVARLLKWIADLKH